MQTFSALSTGPLCREYTGLWWIPFTNASDAELWCFLWSVPQQTDKQPRCWWFETPLRPLWRHCKAPRRSGCNLRLIMLKFILWIHILSISSEITLRWATRGLTGYCSKLVQVMARCRQATGNYRSQYWPRSVSPYGVARPKCHMASLGLNELKHGSKYKKPS